MSRGNGAKLNLSKIPYHNVRGWVYYNLWWWYDLTLSSGLLSRHMFRWLVEADGLGMDLAATMFFVITKGEDLSRSIRAS